MATDDAIRPRVALDLASLASRAALELDDLHRGRDITPVAIEGLIDTITREFSPTEGSVCSTPRRPRIRAIMVMKRAISDSQYDPTGSGASDVLRETSAIVDTLRRVADSPSATAWVDNPDILQMRSLCLALSRRASAARAMREEE